MTSTPGRMACELIDPDWLLATVGLFFFQGNPKGKPPAFLGEVPYMFVALNNFGRSAQVFFFGRGSKRLLLPGLAHVAYPKVPRSLSFWGFGQPVFPQGYQVLQRKGALLSRFQVIWASKRRIFETWFHHVCTSEAAGHPEQG